jgi:hypothetical protein
MSEPMKGFNRAQRNYDAMEPPEYWAPPAPDCPECDEPEALAFLEEGRDRFGFEWRKRRCVHCGYEHTWYLD